MSFTSVVAGINGGNHNHWYKCNDASGGFDDSGPDADHCGTKGGSGTATFQVTGSEDAGTNGLAIQLDGDVAYKSSQQSMGGATTGSGTISFKSINNAANMSSATASICSIGDPATGQIRMTLQANRNSDSNGVIRLDMTNNSNGIDTFVAAVDWASGAWDDDAWHQYTWVQRGDGNGIIFYIDGAAPTQTHRIFGTGDVDDFCSQIGITDISDLSIGSEADTGFQRKSEGVIDNFLLWENYALTVQEVADLWGASQHIQINSFTRRTGRRTFNDLL